MMNTDRSHSRHPRLQTPRARAQGSQRGAMLIESLVAIMIFSLGVLSVIQLQALSIKQSSGAEQRSMASLLANDLVSRMWASDKTAATLQNNFSSELTSATGYTQWLSTVRSSGLPNVSKDKGTLPEVKFTSVDGGSSGSFAGPSSSRATITIYWMTPGDSTKHAYTTVAQFK